MRLLERRSHVNIMESQSGLGYQTGVRWCGSITVTLCTTYALYYHCFSSSLAKKFLTRK